MVAFIDESLRDGPQSLWATRMTTQSMIPAAPLLDRAGFDKLCVLSGASFETAVRFLNDDPWERVRLMRQLMPNSALEVLIRSRNLFGWSQYSDDVIELLFKCLRDAGVEWLKVFDGLNDINIIAAHFGIARKLGLKCAGILTYSVSPFHTDEYYAGKTRELLAQGMDALVLIDASGILTGARARTLIEAVKGVVQGRVPIEFYAHASMGLAHDSYREAIAAGVDAVTTACEPLGNGESLPTTRDIARIVVEAGGAHGLDEQAVMEADEYFYGVAAEEGHPAGRPREFDPATYDKFVGHQIPGGMISNFRRQLTEAGMFGQIDEVLEEAGRVRAELGYPIMVTPFSQFVGVQATLNVINQERYAVIPQELRQYVLGYYGSSGAPIDQTVLDRILDGRSLDPVDPVEVCNRRPLKHFRKTLGDHPDEEMLLHIFYGGEMVARLRENQNSYDMAPRRPSPLPVLIKRILSDPSIRTFSARKGDVEVSIGNRGCRP